MFFVYANFPLVNTEHIIRALSKHSEDPLCQVVCLAYDKETMTVLGYGVNKIISSHSNTSMGKATVATDKHPAKKFLMRHAEQDWLLKAAGMTKESKERTGIYMSLQPCMNCLSSLLDAGFTDIQWAEPNRHQEEQQLIKPFISSEIKYNELKSGLMLQVPSWIVSEYELRQDI